MTPRRTLITLLIFGASLMTSAAWAQDGQAAAEGDKPVVQFAEPADALNFPAGQIEHSLSCAASAQHCQHKTPPGLLTQ